MNEAASLGAGPQPRLPVRLRSAAAGVAGALATLAVVLTLGLLAFAPMGPLAAGLGIPAA
ncbi:MAG: hypothetical protein JNL30_13820, partial [Rubrivivax sp.]|nr:hypothetical protein [Rubrivivax sp.]